MSGMPQKTPPTTEDLHAAHQQVSDGLCAIGREITMLSAVARLTAFAVGFADDSESIGTDTIIDACELIDSRMEAMSLETIVLGRRLDTLRPATAVSEARR